MSRLKSALVNFYKELRGKRVVEISDIVDFSPTHHGDFVENQTYRVKWPHFPNEDSFSSEVSTDDLEHEVNGKGQKLPSHHPYKEVPKESISLSKSSKGRPITLSSQAKKSNRTVNSSTFVPPPRAKKKRKQTIEDNIKSKQNRNLIESYGKSTVPFPSSPLRSTEVKDQVQIDEGSDDKALFPSELKRKGDSKLNCQEVPRSEAHRIANSTYNKQNEKEKQDTSLEEQHDEVKSPEGSSSQRQCEVKSSVLSSKLQSKLTMITWRPRKKPSKYLEKYFTSEDGSSDPYLPSDEEKDLYYQKNLKLELYGKELKANLSTAQVKSAQLEKDLEEMKKTIYEQKAKISALEVERDAVKQLNSRLSTVNLSLSEQRASKLVSKREKRSSPAKFTIFTSPNAPSPVANISSPRASGAFSPQPLCRESPFASWPILDFQKRGTAKKALWKSPELKSPRQRDAIRSLVTSAPSQPDEGSPFLKKKKRSTFLEENIESNETLSHIIYDALLKKLPLRSDGSGKSHLGNNVWLNTKIFDKISKPQVAPSIAVRDAMSCLYLSDAELAERSLDGGTPVKAADKAKGKKRKLTPAKREALLALYRAKMQQTTGSSDRNFLDLAVSKQGKSTLREKLKEAAKRKQKALLKATLEEKPKDTEMSA